MNDHLSTRHYVRDAWPTPPDYFEPLVTLSSIAARTSVLRLMTAILILPLRQPVPAAKQIATLDNLSDGRVMIGAEAGHRDEFEAVCPDMKDQSRAELCGDGLQGKTRRGASRTSDTNPQAGGLRARRCAVEWTGISDPASVNVAPSA